MAVIIRYVVERNGAEKMTFTSKAEADAYDKMLDIADELTQFISGSALLADEQLTEALSLYMAQHKDELLVALGAKKPPVKANNTDKKHTAAKAKVAAVEQAA